MKIIGIPCNFYHPTLFGSKHFGLDMIYSSAGGSRTMLSFGPQNALQRFSTLLLQHSSIRLSASRYTMSATLTDIYEQIDQSSKLISDSPTRNSAIAEGLCARIRGPNQYHG